MISHTSPSRKDTNDPSAVSQFAYKNAYIYLYEVVLHLPAPSSASNGSREGGNELITAYTTLMFRLLEVTKAFMDDYVQIPFSKIEQGNTIHCLYLSHTAIVLLKLAFSTVGASPEDPFPFRKACNVSRYLEAMAGPEPTCDTSSHSLDDGVARDSMWQFRDKVLRMKSWYDRMEFFNDGGNVEDLKGMSPLQLENISRHEVLPPDVDWSTFDFTNLDVVNIWD